MRKLLDEIRRRNIPVVPDVHAAAHHIRATLTTRELEIFERLASEATNAEISRDLLAVW
jgi:FixJ family two-component response regulator